MSLKQILRRLAEGAMIDCGKEQRYQEYLKEYEEAMQYAPTGQMV